MHLTNSFIQLVLLIIALCPLSSCHNVQLNSILETMVINESDVQFLRSFNVGFDNEDIRKVQRLGSRAEAHVRPILIQLGSRHMKNLIMESLFKIKSMDAQFKNVIVAHNMTRKQTEEGKLLVTEAKVKSDEESGDWIYKVREQPGQIRIIKIRKLN